jgi:hypothetical protein
LRIQEGDQDGVSIRALVLVALNVLVMLLHCWLITYLGGTSLAKKHKGMVQTTKLLADVFY